MIRTWTWLKQKFPLGALALLGCWPLLSFAKIVDPDHVVGPYGLAGRTLQKTLEPMPGKDILEKIEAYGRREGIDPNTAYILKRLTLLELDLQGRTQEVLALCQDVKADDYEIRALCESINPERSRGLVAQEIEKIWEQSLKDFPGTTVPLRISIVLLNIAFETSDISRAREVYQKAMEMTPPDARRSQLDLTWVAANVYSSALNSPKIQREGMKLYDELEQAYRQDADSLSIAEMIAFNKGLSGVTLFHDYELALKEFSKIPRGSAPWVDAQIYSALAYFRLNQPAKAKDILSRVEVKDAGELKKIPSLACYQSIVAFGLKESADLEYCFDLLEKLTGPDTSLEFTHELMHLDLPPDMQLRVLQNFWKVYRKQIEPKVHQIMENNTNAIELARVRTENLVKDLDMKNFNLLKIIAAGLIAGLFLSALMLWNLRSKNKSIQKLQTYIREAVLARFLPPVIVEEIIQGQSRLEAEPKDELVTLMFCDIVGFTALSGELGRPRTVALLNDFMQIVTEVVYKHEGTIDKFIGDAAMVIFGAPASLDAKEQAVRAMGCAQDLLVAMSQRHDFKLRIGIHQGMATVGIFGSERRSDFTAIGSTVNIASRIEGRAQPQEILLSEAVAHHLPDHWVEDCGFHELRGIIHPVRLYRARTGAAIGKAS